MMPILCGLAMCLCLGAIMIAVSLSLPIKFPNPGRPNKRLWPVLRDRAARQKILATLSWQNLALVLAVMLAWMFCLVIGYPKMMHTGGMWVGIGAGWFLSTGWQLRTLRREQLIPMFLNGRLATARAEFERALNDLDHALPQARYRLSGLPPASSASLATFGALAQDGQTPPELIRTIHRAESARIELEHAEQELAEVNGHSSAKLRTT